MTQERGVIGKLVGGMIRRSVQSRFRNVYWQSPSTPLKPPIVFYANHHGWMDGYLMFHLVSRVGIPCVDWIEEFQAFPLFRFVGGMPYPRGDALARAKTIRQTVRLMRDGGSLLIFPEGVLHKPPEILPFGRALELVSRKVQHVSMVPVSIHYEMSMHERPEAWLSMGDSHKFESLQLCESRLGIQLASLKTSISVGQKFDVLVKGKQDVNERFSRKGGRTL